MIIRLILYIVYSLYNSRQFKLHVFSALQTGAIT